MEKKYIAGINFELTRRCNLNCKWCSKGEAQDLDMRKEIIDKTLNEVSDYWIDTIRINGGEPSLVPDLIEYLIDGIIKRQIKVKLIHMITDATIKSKKIKDCIPKFLNYSKKITKEREQLKEYFNPHIITPYKSLIGKDSAWVMHLSTWEHDNLSTFDDVKEFYNIEHENYTLITQNELSDREHKGIDIAIEGSAEKNYKMFSKEELKNIRIICNNFCIISDYYKNNTPCIQKILSIGANGNVYVGCMKSYSNIDKDFLFNIMDCNKDFWKKVDEWCWKNPISPTANTFQEKYLSLKWKYEHNIENIKKETVNSFEKLSNHIKLYKEILIEYHNKLPFLNHDELNLCVVSMMCEWWYQQGVTLELLELFIKNTTGLDDEVIKLMGKDTVHNITTKLIKQNNDRAIENINNPITKFLATIYANV